MSKFLKVCCRRLDVNKYQVINSLPFFDSFQKDDIENLSDFIYLQSYKSGELIIDENIVNTSLFFLINGSVDIIVENRLVSKSSNFGDIFGEMSIAGQKPSYAKLKSREDSVFLVLNFVGLGDMPEERRGHFERLIYKSFSEVLANRLARANQKIRSLKKSRMKSIKF